MFKTTPVLILGLLSIVVLIDHEAASAMQVASDSVETTTPIYVYRMYHPETRDETFYSFAKRRIENTDGSFVIEQFVVDDLKSPTSIAVYDRNSVPLNYSEQWQGEKSEIEYGESSATILWKGETRVVDVPRTDLVRSHLVWFWKTQPEIGQQSTESSLSQNSGTINLPKTYTYIRDEPVKVMDSEIVCHVVEETRSDTTTENGEHKDTLWYDESGMLVKHEHVVGDSVTITLLTRKAEPD